MQDTALVAGEATLFCSQNEVPLDGTPIARNFKGRSVVVARRSPNEDALVAFEGKCPHMQAPLRFGRVVDGEVVCPWHFFRFDAVSGEAVACNKSLMKLQTYSVTLESGSVYVHI